MASVTSADVWSASGTEDATELGQDENQGLQRPPREAGHWTKVSPASLVTGFAGGGSTVASGVPVFSLVCVMWTFCRFYS